MPPRGCSLLIGQHGPEGAAAMLAAAITVEEVRWCLVCGQASRACRRAWTTSSVRMWVSRLEPMTRREPRSMTTARHSQRAARLSHEERYRTEWRRYAWGEVGPSRKAGCIVL